MIDERIENGVAERMIQRGLTQRDIDFFLTALSSISKEEVVDWQHVRPVSSRQVISVPDDTGREYQRLHELGMQNLGKCAVIKLNGGLSTTLGGNKPKCVVRVKQDLSFLEIVLKQLMASNDRNGVEMSLVLMNSFYTREVTRKILGDTPLMIMDFEQNEFPRIQEETLLPLDTGMGQDWCPGGHGDFFFSLERSGMLDSMLSLGIRYAFVSNIDNLAAVAAPEILGLMISRGHDFCMEVTKKTEADRKGGAPVLYKDSLSLLEIAQVPEKYISEFQDISTFGYFNTNNLWVDLLALKGVLNEDRLDLPVIMNRKKICGTDVIQIERAMGAALGSFDRPGLIEVDRSRFAPVKTREDLFDLRSELYIMKEDYQISRKGNQVSNHRGSN